MSWNLEGGGIQSIRGLRNPEAAAELLSDPNYQELTMSFGTEGFEVDSEPNALEYRGVQVHKMTRNSSNPFMPPRVQENYYAVAGDYFLATTYAPDAERIKALIDSVLDKEVKLAPLPGNTLWTMSMQFAGFMNMMGVGELMGEIPESVNIELAKSDGQLVIKMDMK